MQIIFYFSFVFADIFVYESRLPAVNDTGRCDFPPSLSIFEYAYLGENEAKLEKFSKIVCGPRVDIAGVNNSKNPIPWIVPLSFNGGKRSCAVLQQ